MAHIYKKSLAALSDPRIHDAVSRLAADGMERYRSLPPGDPLRNGFVIQFKSYGRKPVEIDIYIPDIETVEQNYD